MPATTDYFTVDPELCRFGPNKGRTIWVVNYRGNPAGPMMDFFEKGMGLRYPWPFKEDGKNESLIKEEAEKLLEQCLSHVREVVGNQRLDKSECSARTWTI